MNSRDLYSLALTCRPLFELFCKWKFQHRIVSVFGSPCNIHHQPFSCPLCNSLPRHLSLFSAAPLFESSFVPSAQPQPTPLSTARKISSFAYRSDPSEIIAVATKQPAIFAYSSSGSLLQTIPFHHYFIPCAVYVSSTQTPSIFIAGTDCTVRYYSLYQTKGSEATPNHTPTMEFTELYNNYVVASSESGFTYFSSNTTSSASVDQRRIFIDTWVPKVPKGRPQRFYHDKDPSCTKTFADNQVITLFTRHGLLISDLRSRGSFLSKMEYGDPNISKLINTIKLSEHKYLLVTDSSIFTIDTRNLTLDDVYNHVEVSSSKIVCATSWNFGHGMLMVGTSNSNLSFFQINPNLEKIHESNLPNQITSIDCKRGLVALSAGQFGLSSVYDLAETVSNKENVANVVKFYNNSVSRSLHAGISQDSKYAFSAGDFICKYDLS
ncbi:hypothetical protein P9112_013885 [Eukaryota sp. TZLM1-RC]